MEVTAIILAGGKSSRMGSDKGLLPLHGLPLIQYSINACAGITGNIIIITSNAEYGRFGYPLVKDNFAGNGPMGGLEAALAVSDTEINLICPCDMPGIQTDTLKILLGAGRQHQTVVARDRTGKLFPVLGVYRRSALPVIRELIQLEDYRLTRLLERLGAHSVLVGDAGQLVNFNSPGDLL